MNQGPGRVQPKPCHQEVFASTHCYLVWPCHLMVYTTGTAMPVPPSQPSERLGLDISRCLFGFSYFLVFNWFQM